MTESAQPLPPARPRFKTYSAYKDSGVEWLGKIPASWEVIRLKRLIAEPITDGPHETPEFLIDGVPFLSVDGIQEGELVFEGCRYISEAAHKEYARKCAPRRDDILLGKAASTGKIARVKVDFEFSVWSPLALIRAAERDVWPGFLEYALKSAATQAQIDVLCTSSTQKNISMRDIPILVLSVTELTEQRAIAAFLDRETARIDALVAKKERLIDLLQEQCTALITRVVTKGLDPTVPMKDSGVEWLGEIPAHWELKRLWHLTPCNRRIMYGIVLPGPNVDNGVPIVKGGDVSTERLRLERLNRTTREIESGYVRSRLRAGDLVYAIRGSIGEVAMVPEELEGANLTQDAARIAYTASTHGPWLVHALKSAAVFAQLETGALGATIRGINIRDLKRASMAVPPCAEQRAIAQFLDRETARIAVLVAKVSDAIDRLREFRTALISAAVTGKIDVREDVA